MRPLWIVFGTTIYHPTGVDPSHSRYAILRERLAVYVRQQDKLGLFWFFLLYFLVLPLPWLAWGRWRLEREAHLEISIRRAGQLPEAVVERLGGRRYVWMWPRRYMLAWFRKQLGDA